MKTWLLKAGLAAVIAAPSAVFAADDVCAEIRGAKGNKEFEKLENELAAKFFDFRKGEFKLPSMQGLSVGPCESTWAEKILSPTTAKAGTSVCGVHAAFDADDGRAIRALAQLKVASSKGLWVDVGGKSLPLCTSTGKGKGTQFAALHDSDERAASFAAPMAAAQAFDVRGAEKEFRIYSGIFNVMAPFGLQLTIPGVPRFAKEIQVRTSKGCEIDSVRVMSPELIDPTRPSDEDGVWKINGNAGATIQGANIFVTGTCQLQLKTR